jgi:hypothetical protein
VADALRNIETGAPFVEYKEKRYRRGEEERKK